MNKAILTITLYFMVSLAFAQWEPDVRLTNDAASTFLSNPNNHPIVASGDTIHAVFVDDRSGKFQVYYTRSLDGGVTWDSALCMSNDSSNLFYPALGVSGATVHLAWSSGTSQAMMYRRSIDAGATWSEEDTLIASTLGLGDPSFAVEGNTVGLAWGDERDGNRNGEEYFKRSTDGGITWGPDTRLTFRPDTIDKSPCLAVAGSFWHLTWVQSSWSTFTPHAWYVRSTNGGASWELPIPLATDTTYSDQPVVAVVGSNVHIVWYDGRAEASGIYYRRSTDNGTTWSAELRVSDTTRYPDYPGITAVGGNIHTAFRTQSLGQFSIGYCGSTDNGMTWSAETLVTTAAGMGTSALAAAGNRVHVILYDNRDGNYEIYYKRNPTGSGIEEEPIMHDAQHISSAATILSGIMRLEHSEPAVLLDITGRKVVDLKSGTNDIRHLAPGVYFIREQSAFISQLSGRPAMNIAKVVVVR